MKRYEEEGKKDGPKNGSALYAYVGAWASDLHMDGEEQEANGGIRIYTVDREIGKLQLTGQVSKDINAGILCISKDGRYLYSVDERKDRGKIPGAGGGVYSYQIRQEDGLLQPLNSQSSAGAFPCYTAIDPKGEFLFASNHGHHFDIASKTIKDIEGECHVERIFDDGSAVMFPLNEDGSLAPASYVDVLSGSSVNPIYQNSPHPHSIHVDANGRFVIVCDKGTDQIRVYRIDRQKRCLHPMEPAYKAKNGSGPRHLAFHPRADYIFVNSELDSTVHSYHFKEGKIEEICSVRTIPADYQPVDPQDHFAANFTADIQIHPSGRFLYVTNRGAESIAAFRVLEESGRLELIGYYDACGRVPRALRIMPGGKFLFVVNQRSGNIIRFCIDGETGELSRGEEVLKLPNPVCMRFLER